MRETVLLYNIASVDPMNKIKMTCIRMGIRIKSISPQEYKVPIGYLAYGTEEEIRTYMEQDGVRDSFAEPMMVLAGLSPGRMNQFLEQMRKNKAPYIGLKAMLTEHNAVWDSLSLYTELEKEHEAMTGKKS